MIHVDFYNKLTYNVAILPPSEKVLDKWPELKNIESFAKQSTSIEDPNDTKKKIILTPYGGLDPDKVLRYIFCLYDRETPIIRELPNLFSQKVEAATLAGFEKVNDAWPTKVSQLFSCKFKDVNQAILEFSRMQRSAEWQMYVVLTMKHYQDQEAIVNRDEKAAKSSELLSDAAEIDKLRLKLINFDTSDALRESIEEYNMEIFNLRVEQIGQKIANGDPVVDIRPYE
jgi:hypothetical protein